jgi:putative glutamine amidotransferase
MVLVEKGQRIPIGVSAEFSHADPKRALFKGKTLLYLEESLSHWVAGVEALPFLIPSFPAARADYAAEVAAHLSGLVLMGGSDVAPETYGEKPLRPEWAGDPIRDAYEIALVKEFRKQKKPILGICRGIQILNVALGGTLYQDITEQVPGAHLHRDWHRYDQNFHPVRLEPGGQLAALYSGITSAVINSVHHQAVKDLAPGLIVEARSEVEGIVEAVSFPGEPFLLGIQWHPEFPAIGREVLSGAPLRTEFLRQAQRYGGTL